MTPPRRLIILLSLLMPMISGCTTPSGDIDWIVPSPEVGDLFKYAGSDGATLVALIGPVSRIADVGGKSVPAQVIEWRWDHERLETPLVMHQWVRPDSGTIVRVDAKCGQPGLKTETEFLCANPDLDLISFATEGFAAAGVSTLWGRSATDWPGVQPGSVNPILPLIWHDVEAVMEKQEHGCLAIGGRAPLDAQEVGSFPMTVLAGPVVMCPGESMPRTFVPPGASRFTGQRFAWTMEDRSSGQDVTRLAFSDEPNVTLQSPDLRPLHQAGYVVHDGMPGPDAESAFRAALEQSKTFREIIERQPTARRVAESEWRISGNADTIIDKYREYTREFAAADDNGTMYRVQMTARVREAGLFEDQPWTVEEEWWDGRREPRSLESIPAEIASVERLAAIADQLKDPETELAGYRISDRPWGHAIYQIGQDRTGAERDRIAFFFFPKEGVSVGILTRTTFDIGTGRPITMQVPDGSWPNALT